MLSRNQAKKLAHSEVKRLTKKQLHEVVMEGCVGHVNDNRYRLTTMVILTARTENGLFQGVGVSYLNPTPYEGHPNGDEYDDKLAYRIARGYAELSLGSQILFFDGGIEGIGKFTEEQIIRSVYRLPAEIRRWN